MAEPLKLTPALIVELTGYVGAGLAIKEACALVGIGKSTFYRWMRTAEEDEKAGLETPFTEFAAAIDAAQARMEGVCLARIQQAAENPKTWTAAAWLLERKWPQRYALRNRVELTGADGEAMELVIKFDKKPELKQPEAPEDEQDS